MLYLYLFNVLLDFMRLKQLYLKGFKSFAEETIINFEHDVIGVVGPNGSGKSNIVDAIRWVLGEQKGKELRLNKMADVIFNGTKKKKKSKVAKVAITFDNNKALLPTEYSTITISRLLYQSGESEYRLNDVPCRLKDIQNILVDTGIGSNSYAIIALGMVDDILANKDNARRRMFEQAAGISKFKKRKKETLNKLKNTNADLERIEDLLAEIEANLKALQKQARRTERYYKIKEKYKMLSIRYALQATKDHLIKSDELKKSISQENDRTIELRAKIDQLEALLQKQRNVFLEFEMNLSGQQQELNKRVDQLRNLEATKNNKQQELKFLNKEIESLRAQIQHNDALLKDLQNTVRETQQLVDDQQAEAQNFGQNLQELKKRKDAIAQNNSVARQELDDLMQQKSKAEQKRYEFEKQIAIVQNEMDNLKKDLERKKKESELNQKYAEDFKVLEADLTQRIELLRHRFSELKTNIAQEKQQQERLLKEKQTLEENYSKIVRSLDAKSNEHELILSMLQKMEGSPESIKFLSKQKNWSPSAVLLSDILLVDDAYRVCLENFLEPYLNHYVVDTEREALAAIDLLSNAQRGRAKFFVLDQIKPIAVTDDPPKNAVLAKDVVNVDPKFQALLSGILHQVIILEQDYQSLRPQDSNWTILSADGQFMRLGSELMGGSVGLFEGKRIGRKKQLEQLTQQIKKLKAQKEKIDTQRSNIDLQLANLQIDQLIDQADAIQLELHALEQEKVVLDVKMHNISSHIKDYDELTTEAAGQEETLLAQKRQLQQDLGQQIRILDDLDRQMIAADSSYQSLISDMNEVQSAYNQENIRQIQFDNKLNEWRKEIEFNTRRIKELHQDSLDAQQRLESNHQTVTSLEKELKELEEQIIVLYTDKQKEQDKLSSQEKSYYKAREEIHEVEEQLRRFNRQANQSQSLLSDLKEKYNIIKLELSSVRERLRVEFEVELDALDQTVVEQVEPVDDLREQVEKLRHKIHNFGEINPLAIEAYQEIEKRYLSITEQRDDILAAKDSLLQTIEEIETSATEKFMLAFEQVRSYFQEVFRSLFTEDDTCDLILIDPESPLDSAIEIVAKPKGKRPKSLSQLSGGEKTLTATALLFALYLLKPAPFCIFDEVDAPLDDANIEKFNRIIKRFSKQSQFIVVTHNKQTMAAVDIIYGVYMEEMGVSGLSPVDFSTFQYDGILRTVETQ